MLILIAKMKNILRVLFLLGFLYGCSEEVSKQSSAENNTPIKFENKKFERYLTECAKEDTCLSLVYNYPQFPATGTFNQKLNAFIDSLFRYDFMNSDFQNSWDDVYTNAEGEYLSLATEFPDHASPWTFDRRVTVANSGFYLTIQFDEFTYSGGAHPNSFRQYYNFDTKSFVLIELSTILDLKKAADIAEAEFRRLKNIESGKSYSELGYFFSDDKFYLSTNFGILEKGLIFRYDHYEIAPYSMGATDLFVSFEDLEPALRETFRR